MRATIYGGTSTSISDNEFSLNATGIASFPFRIYFASTNAAQIPFGDGFLCVSAPFARIGMPGGGTSDSNAPLALDLSAPLGALGPVQPGTVYRFQLAYRDTGGANGFNTTDGLAVTFCP